MNIRTRIRRPALDLSMEQPPGDLLVDWGLSHTLSQQFAITLKCAAFGLLELVLFMVETFQSRYRMAARQPLL